MSVFVDLRPRDSDMVNASSPMKDDEIASIRFLKQIEINQALTALYCMVEVGRWQIAMSKNPSIRHAISMTAHPSLAIVLMSTLGSRPKTRLLGLPDSDSRKTEMGRLISAAGLESKHDVYLKVEWYR